MRVRGRRAGVWRVWREGLGMVNRGWEGRKGEGRGIEVEWKVHIVEKKTFYSRI